MDNNEKPLAQPLQPLYVDERGAVRFQPNKIVRWLLDSGRLDLNEIGIISEKEDFSAADRMQLAQLIGYSVDGFCDLSYITDDVTEAVLEAAEPLRSAAPPAKENDKDGPSPT